MKHTVALKQNHEFRRLYSKGKSAVSPYFAIYCRKTKRPNSRLGITTGLKLGNAVKRNRARRRIRELYRTNESRLLPGYDIVVVARTRVIYGSYGELERSFLQLMRKLGICPPRGARDEGPAALDDPFLPTRDLASAPALLPIHPHLLPVCPGGGGEVRRLERGAGWRCAVSCGATPSTGRNPSSTTPCRDGGPEPI